MSSPVSRRSKRSSVAGTPTQSRTPRRNGSTVVATPTQSRNSRENGNAVNNASEPPSIWFNDSPANGRSAARTPLNGSVAAQDSEMGDNEVTPTGNGGLAGESSPLRFASSSSPPRSGFADGRRARDNNNPSSSSALFVRSPRSDANARDPVSRSDIQSDFSGSAPGRRRRMFVDENGMPVGEGAPNSDAATFSNLQPNTSEADAMGGSSTRTIWGTNVSLQDTIATFKGFLLNFHRGYRMRADGEDESAITDPAARAGEKEYIEMMKNMLHLGLTNLNLDCRNLKCYPRTAKLWHQLQAYPVEIIPIMDQTVKDVMFDLAEEEMHRIRQEKRQNDKSQSAMPSFQSSDAREQPENAENEDSGPDLVQEVETRSYKTKPFGLDSSINMRELDPNDLDKLVSIKGLVIRTTPIIPDMKIALFTCSVCGHAIKVSLDRGKIAEPTECPRKACNSKNSMQIVHNRCEFTDKQIIKLQETPDNMPDGQTPHSVSLCAYEEIVDVCKAGDRIEVTGIFRSNPVRVNPRQRTIKNLFKTYIDILHVQKVDKKRMGIDTTTIEQELSEQIAGNVQQVRKFTEEEERKIKRIAQRGDLYDLLSRSLAPGIYELDDVKKGILLQLFGGTNKSFQKGGSPKYRGDINVLLCGDPSTAKSQLLSYVHRIAPRGVYTSGKGSSAVGLTAYVTRDIETRQLVLESGALVLSDGGICCIDEFDKMSESTRSVLHEVMEQQTVSVAKAGIITTLNARTSILASANPIGSKYNPNLPVPQNIDLPPTLLSRFDLVYLVLDSVDEQADRRLAKHLVGMYLDDKPEHGSSEEILPIDFLTTYITYARNTIHPRLTSAASTHLINSYVSMRSLGADIRSSERRITATTRQLESMIRLAEAHAKMRLSSEVTAADVEEAVRLIQSAIKQAATDARTGLIDMGLLTEGSSAGERKRKEDLKRELLGLLDEMVRGGGSVRYAEVFRRMSEGVVAAGGGGGGAGGGIDGGEFAEAMRGLEMEGKVTVSGEGGRRIVRRIGMGI